MLMRFAAAAEKGSEHPLGAAVVAGATAFLKGGSDIPQVESCTAVPGGGVTATVEGSHVCMGTARFLEQNGAPVPGAAEWEARFKADGKSMVFLAVEGKARAVLAFRDRIREHAVPVLAELRRQGLSLHLLTGDSEGAARAVASELRIDDCWARLLPKDKLEALRRLKAEGWTAMVGDGINDAPALAAADVGIAMGGGTDIAVEAGSVVLMRNDLTALPAAVRLARKTMRKIRQNLLWALLYNTVAIAVAATGHLNPEVSALAMACSSVSVLLNSLSLRHGEI